MNVDFPCKCGGKGRYFSETTDRAFCLTKAVYFRRPRNDKIEDGVNNEANLARSKSNSVTWEVGKGTNRFINSNNRLSNDVKYFN